MKISLTNVAILMAMMIHVHAQLDFINEDELGKPCQHDDNCGDSEIICFKGKCSYRRDYGQPCKLTGYCVGALICNQGICGAQNYLPVGADCQSNSECRYYCGDNHKCSGAPGHSGCSSNDQCPKGWRCNAGTCIE